MRGIEARGAAAICRGCNIGVGRGDAVVGQAGHRNRDVGHERSEALGVVDSRHGRVTGEGVCVVDGDGFTGPIIGLGADQPSANKQVRNLVLNLERLFVDTVRGETVSDIVIGVGVVQVALAELWSELLGDRGLAERLSEAAVGNEVEVVAIGVVEVGSEDMSMVRVGHIRAVVIGVGIVGEGVHLAEAGIWRCDREATERT